MIVICIARVLSIEAKPHQWCNSPRVVESIKPNTKLFVFAATQLRSQY